MKYTIALIILIITSLESVSAATALSLKPSLMREMKKNEILVKENIKNEQIQKEKQRVLANKQKLLALQQSRKQKTTIAKKPQTTQQKTQQIALAPKITPVITPAQISTKTVTAPQTLTSPSQKSNNIIASNISYIPTTQVRNVDMDRVRQTWLSWTNSVRKDLGLQGYILDTRLNTTAIEWSEFSKGRGYIIHGRPGDGCIGAYNYGCYNFDAIDTWFSARGINPPVKSRAKHTENIGYGAYRCSSGDCTDSLINAIRKTFDFYMSEKGKTYDPHYRSIIQPNFSKIGVGIVVDESKGVYYLTVHYITE